ncbi:hypothetical protein C3B44_09690 [Corynebacterium yudongzhengii]|uniref:Uncharacterized protein n=1 Tax=Corynebacterium yudongzhengii TaxID=2080740 RepID=A0A2U1T5L8_9CORY|nr:hypothetical protein [Corynebacterium yudongzhengii]AWB82576.1 hypothetical protein C3B44_09690 [Corynebacterium yudongzhengii]PWC01310.1 hypothetical protein DF222_07840 [Corynebacterium yudongzhengii]
MQNLSSPNKIAQAFLAVIVGIWAYCLVVAPMLTEGSYTEVVAEKSREIGIGFTIAAAAVGAICYVIAKKNSQK